MLPPGATVTPERGEADVTVCPCAFVVVISAAGAVEEVTTVWPWSFVVVTGTTTLVGAEAASADVVWITTLPALSVDDFVTGTRTPLVVPPPPAALVVPPPPPAFVVVSPPPAAVVVLLGGGLLVVVPPPPPFVVVEVAEGVLPTNNELDALEMTEVSEEAEAEAEIWPAMLVVGSVADPDDAPLLPAVDAGEI